MPETRALIEAHIPRLRRYARALLRNPVDADDLVQQTMLRALSKLHLWQPGSDLRAWLFAIMHNEHVNEVRRAIRNQKIVASLVTETGCTGNQHASLQLRDLKNALDRLPTEHRSVLLLIGLEGMSYEEAAEIRHVPVGTIRSRLSRARSVLRQLMDELAPAPVVALPGRTREHVFHDAQPAAAS
jgi:RNA polymerase sigma-70 factor (ECF subfamily)